jgi:N-acetylglucosamine malate deacetylase 1
MNPYENFVSEYARLLREGKSLPMGGFAPRAPLEIPKHGAPVVLIFSPHPDDECIIGGLPLRLLRETGMRVINVAVTQGSRKDRQQERFEELQKACKYLGYGLVQTQPNGLEKVNAKIRKQEPGFWKQSVQIIADIIAAQQPHAIFCPHEHDWNSTHIGTHWLVMDALRELGRFDCFVVEAEFWGAMASPNLMIESSLEQVADMVAGTSFHVGEVRRNPFHLFLPAWMQDNVRRGSELVGGQGEAAPAWTFATLYRVRQWHGEQRQLRHHFEGGKQISCAQNVTQVFQEAARV